MALILDTNALSAFADGDRALLRIIAHEDLAIPAIVLGEYLFGIRHSRLRVSYMQWLQNNLPAFEVLEVGQETARHYANVRAELKSAGRPIPSNDVWIAAVAREYALPIVTQDTHFRSVPSLHLLPW